MLIVGIGGLWFIPTFHNITKLSPFLGALCVLSVLWIVNEIFNRKLNNVDKMIQSRVPRVLQYGVIQMMLFIVGIVLLVGVIIETGVLPWVASWVAVNIHNVWVIGTVAGLISTVLDNFATAATFFSFFDVATTSQGFAAAMVQNGIYWKIIALLGACCRKRARRGVDGRTGLAEDGAHARGMVSQKCGMESSRGVCPRNGCNVPYVLI